MRFPSAAEAGFFLTARCGTAEAVPFPVKVEVKIRIKVNVKGDGQECPSHTSQIPTL
jgi:hypothetical protein